MAHPKLRCRRKPPAPALRTMDLLGLGKDGRLYLWEPDSKVLPCSRFERRGDGIVCGHYLVEWDGRAITVHCSNLTDSRIGVQFMCDGVRTLNMARKHVEEILLGRVIPDPVKAAELSRLLKEATEAVTRQQTASHRLRKGR